jgi:HD superfamily phosphohydrolase
MELVDALYDAWTIEEPVLLDLLATPTVVRLRGVHQAGAVWLVRPERAVTRYEHSVGTMLLVRQLGGTLEEQVAALLHDAGHGAFSHVIDRVFDAADDCWHEREGLAWLARTEVPALLVRHGLDPTRILSPHGWSLLDRPAPDLCADRLDYALRDGVSEGLLSVDEVTSVVGALAVAPDGTIVFTDTGWATWFAERFAALVDTVYLDPVGIWADALLASTIRQGLASGAIAEAGLHGTDAELLAELRASGHAEIIGSLSALVPGAAAEEMAAGAVGIEVLAFPKARTVDPLALLAGAEAAVRASTLDPAITARADALRARAAAGIAVRRTP